MEYRIVESSQERWTNERGRSEFIVKFVFLALFCVIKLDPSGNVLYECFLGSRA